MPVKISIADDQREYGDIEAEHAIVIADDKVYTASSGARAFELWLTLTEWLSSRIPPSKSWQAIHTALAHGRVAVTADKQSQAQPNFTDASTVLGIVKEELGPDAYAKVRQAIADRMLGKRPAG